MSSPSFSTPDWSAPIGGVVHDVPTSMRPAVRDMWVMALRSGAYTQGFHTFRSNMDNFCPLGVLCDLAAMVDLMAWEEMDGQWFILSDSGVGTNVPVEVLDWAGFTGMHISQLVPLVYAGVRHPIWRLNDTFRLSFDTLADLIEAQY